MRLIFDTNVIISRLLLPKSISAKAFSKGLREGEVLVSDDTLSELIEVLSRDKFNKYVSITERKDFIRALTRLILKVSIIKVVRQCRDPKDDKFLELAINGQADLLITGDKDLLTMSNFQDTIIMSPGDYLTYRP